MSSSSCGCGHPDAHADDCEGVSLLTAVDVPRVHCLNEREPGSCRVVFRPLADRRSRDGALRSNEGDPDLLLTVPFTSVVRIKSICISGGSGGGGGAPARARLFVNRDDLDFAAATDGQPAQELELPEDADAALWHPLRAAKFQNVTTLTILLQGAHDDDSSTVYFVGLKGVATGFQRRPVTAVYEARPQLSDHDVRADAGGGKLGM